MDQIKKKRTIWKQRERRRAWAVLSVLWLVTTCFVGCGQSGSGQAETQTRTRMLEAQTAVQDSERKSEVQEIQSGLNPKQTAENVSEELKEDISEESSLTVEESGSYTSKEEVALYVHLYGRLPGNYITKKQAEKLGWDNKAGNLWEVAPGMSIGGSRFGNYEGALPDKKGRIYYECDIDYDGGYRGAKRIIYSNDGLIFYTEDHYKTFEELYGQ